MGTQQQHLEKAQHNENFFNHFDLDTTPYPDWVVTGIFYSALHYIRAVASKYNFGNISSYGDLDNLFSSLSILKRKPAIYQDYRQLKDDSRDARYEMTKLNKKDVQELRDQEFARIKSFTLSLL